MATFSCSRVSETGCPGHHCDGLERCFYCYERVLGDVEPDKITGCYVPSNLLFTTVFVPLIIFFALMGVFLLHRSRIRSSSMKSCLTSVSAREWRLTLFYLLIEVALISDIFFWIIFSVGPPSWRISGIVWGIILSLILSCLLCWGYVATCRRKNEQEQVPVPVNMGMVVVQDPSVRFYAAPAAVPGSGVPVVPGYPVNGYYSNMPDRVAVGVAVGVAPDQVGQIQPTAPPAPASASGVSNDVSGSVLQYPQGNSAYPVVPVTVHGDRSYQPPAYTLPTISSDADPTMAPVKEDFHGEERTL
jgi:hypothetical protein